MSKGLDQLKHIVVLMMENRSFDHMLGGLAGTVPGIDTLTGNESNPDNQGNLVNVAPLAELFSLATLTVPTSARSPLSTKTRTAHSTSPPSFNTARTRTPTTLAPAKPSPAICKEASTSASCFRRPLLPAGTSFRSISSPHSVAVI